MLQKLFDIFKRFPPFAIKPTGGALKMDSGDYIQARQLTLYELDAVPFEDIGPFLYPYKTSSGHIVQTAYDLAQWKTPPEPPETPEAECTDGSTEQAQWNAYHTYQAAIAHRLKQVDSGEQYTKQVAEYILANCVSSTDYSKVISPDDYERLYKYVLNSEVALEDIEAVLASTFPGYIRQWSDIASVIQGIGQKSRERKCDPALERGDSPGVADVQAGVGAVVGEGTFGNDSNAQAEQMVRDTGEFKTNGR